MSINDFLAAAFEQSSSLLETETVIWEGQTLDCVFSDFDNRSDLSAGGFNPEGDSCSLLIAVANFADATRPESRDPVTFRGITWKVERVVIGDVTVTINLYNPKRR